MVELLLIRDVVDVDWRTYLDDGKQTKEREEKVGRVGKLLLIEPYSKREIRSDNGHYSLYPLLNIIIYRWHRPCLSYLLLFHYILFECNYFELFILEICNDLNEL